MHFSGNTDFPRVIPRHAERIQLDPIQLLEKSEVSFEEDFRRAVSEEIPREVAIVDDAEATQLPAVLPHQLPQQSGLHGARRTEDSPGRGQLISREGNCASGGIVEHPRSTAFAVRVAVLT